MGEAIQHFGWRMPSQINPELVVYSLGACHRAFIQAKGKLSLAIEHQLFLGQTNMSTTQLAAVTNRDPQAAVSVRTGGGDVCQASEMISNDLQRTPAHT